MAILATFCRQQRRQVGETPGMYSWIIAGVVKCYSLGYITYIYMHVNITSIYLFDIGDVYV